MEYSAKKALFIGALCLLILLAACGEVKTLDTGIGSFEYEQSFMQSIENETTGTAVPESGHIFLVIHLTPADNTEVSLDEVADYFLGGTQAVLADETYGLYCVAHERIDGSRIRHGLVFEVIDNNYANAAEMPTVQMVLPSAPQ